MREKKIACLTVPEYYYTRYRILYPYGPVPVSSHAYIGCMLRIVPVKRQNAVKNNVKLRDGNTNYLIKPIRPVVADSNVV